MAAESHPPIEESIVRNYGQHMRVSNVLDGVVSGLLAEGIDAQVIAYELAEAEKHEGITGKEGII